MSLAIGNDVDIAGIWFVDASETNGFDWLCSVFKKDGEVWEAVYRFRYHAAQDPNDPKDPFESADEKSWYGVRSEGSDGAAKQKLIEAMRGTAKTLCADARGRLDEMLDVGKGFENFVAATKNKPWIHVKQAASLGNQKTAQA